MNLLKDFYQNLNSLELIIFWGIILIIILLIILLIISINKKKKYNNKITNDDIEEIPIKIEETQISQNESNYTKNTIEQEPIVDQTPEIEMLSAISEEKEEELAQLDIVENENKHEENKYKTTFEMPSAPYQRNVLREMSLSQTSPIGINRKKDEYIKPQELFEIYAPTNKHETPDTLTQIDEEIFSETEYNNSLQDNIEIAQEESLYEDDTQDIERTQYEIEQEENAIISYKELMEKKDSIQTIDEEDAIISIEELLNKKNVSQEIKEENKLYNLTEEEENESFINELKQFRKDL